MSALCVGEVGVSVVFGVEVDEDGCRLVLLSGLGFAAIALFAEGEVEVVAVVADPVSFSGCRLRYFSLTGDHFLHWSVVRLHSKV